MKRFIKNNSIFKRKKQIKGSICKFFKGESKAITIGKNEILKKWRFLKKLYKININLKRKREKKMNIKIIKDK